jgi:hypothetical protein
VPDLPGSMISRAPLAEASGALSFRRPGSPVLSPQLDSPSTGSPVLSPQLDSPSTGSPSCRTSGATENGKRDKFRPLRLALLAPFATSLRAGRTTILVGLSETNAASRAPIGAAEVRPARKGWDTHEETGERRRCDTYPNAKFGSYCTPCFFNRASSSASKVIFAWCDC